MALRRRDVAALLLACVTAVGGIAAVAFGVVELGLELGTDGAGRVIVVGVEPNSIAANYGFASGQLVTALEPIDGGELAHHEPVPMPPEWEDGEIRLPAEAIPESRIGYVEVGEEGPDGQIYPGMSALDRGSWQARLRDGGWLVFLGAGLGGLAAYAASRGWLGAAWRDEGIPIGAAVSIPLMATPILYTGTAGWISVAWGLAAAGSLPVARTLADSHPRERWPTALFGASVVIAGVALLTIVRGLVAGDPPGGGDDRGFVLAWVALAPALASAFGVERGAGARGEMLLVGLGPGAAALVLTTSAVNLAPSSTAAVVAWLAIALGWHRAGERIIHFATRSRSTALTAEAIASEPAEAAPESPGLRLFGVRLRDAAALAIAGVTALGALVACCGTWALIAGAGLGAGVGLAIRRGFLGPAWRGAAVPVGCAVAIPILGAGLSAGGGETVGATAIVLASLGALPVASFLAARHPDPAWRRILMFMAAGLAALAIVVTIQFQVIGEPSFYAGGRAERYMLMGLIALAPGLVVAFSGTAAAGARITERLDTLAVALTPGAAMTVLVPSFGPVLLTAWLAILIAWRRLTIAPLLGLAQRSQRQRDLAVAAVEAERARLAADLHDDALQELSALVRRLDAAGDAEGADLARGVAERLRAITSDLRLPLLDDLGVGPALEWLVGRVRPLADGPVVLERRDTDRPPAGVELAVFRVAQEALANAVKHGASPITVRYRVDDGGVSLSVDDSGPGIEAGAADQALQAGHLGMANMQQRAEQIGALLDIRRWPAGGTHVALEWRPR